MRFRTLVLLEGASFRFCASRTAPGNKSAPFTKIADGAVPELPQCLFESRSTYYFAVTPYAAGSDARGEELVGTLLAERYEIIQLLGHEGRMGAVYKARNKELKRMKS